MQISHKLDKMFNPSATFAGYLLIVAGIALLINGFGLILIILGSFLAFSQSGISIDTSKGQFKYYTLIFGIFPVGKWQSLSPFKKIILLKSNKVYSSYSLSNRKHSDKISDYRVVLADASNRLKIPVIKCRTKEDAIEAAGKLSEALNLPAEAMYAKKQ